MLLSIPFMGFEFRIIFSFFCSGFQFPLWDSGGRFVYIGFLADNFQFPLWDSVRVISTSRSALIVFQFPLWDSRCLKNLLS